MKSSIPNLVVLATTFHVPVLQSARVADIKKKKPMGDEVNDGKFM